ncbi:MAG: glucosamine-6-phosphate deaminase [Mollicutes bacterium PWAP]|nr:glucosamine-6-phosphate deaminase [Mollicutes bacterium PWAP]
MKLFIMKNYDEMSRKASDIIKEYINTKPNLVLGLATGSTPEGTYEILKKEANFKEVITFNLDEYIGISENHPLSYHFYMYKNLFNHVDINKKNIHIPSSKGDIEKNSKDYDFSIYKKGGIDLQLLGLGENAHIGFNEPGSPEDGSTGSVQLTNSTINANSRFFESKSQVPTKAISMGIGTIMKAKSILLIASGLKKAQAVKNMIEGNIDINVPASFLQKHSNVNIVIDEDAASFLKKK